MKNHTKYFSKHIRIFNEKKKSVSVFGDHCIGWKVLPMKKTRLAIHFPSLCLVESTVWDLKVQNMPESVTSTSKSLRKGVVLICSGSPVRKQTQKSKKHNSISKLKRRGEKTCFHK